MINFFKKQTGLSLIEVMVSLTIFAVVFFGIITLVLNSMRLVILSRQKIEAAGLAQDKLEGVKWSKKNECNLAEDNGEKVTEGTKYFFKIVSGPKDFDGVAPVEDGYEVTVTVSWDIRKVDADTSNDSKLVLKQYLSKAE